MTLTEALFLVKLIDWDSSINNLAISVHQSELLIFKRILVMICHNSIIFFFIWGEDMW